MPKNQEMSFKKKEIFCFQYWSFILHDRKFWEHATRRYFEHNKPILHFARSCKTVLVAA